MSLARIGVFAGEKQSLIYLALLKEGPLGAERLHAETGLHRETIQRELKKMQKAGTIRFERHGRNKKATPVPISVLQEQMERNRDVFTGLLKPLIEAQSSQKKPKIEIYAGNHAFGQLELKLIKLQPKDFSIKVIGAKPKAWIEAMIESRKLSYFEQVRLEKEIPFLLTCFSQDKGHVEHNNREYFAAQPQSLKRKYRYVETELNAPLQIQLWCDNILISMFESFPSIHIYIQDKRIAAAFNSYFELLWGIAH